MIEQTKNQNSYININRNNKILIIASLKSIAIIGLVLTAFLPVMIFGLVGLGNFMTFTTSGISLNIFNPNLAPLMEAMKAKAISDTSFVTSVSLIGGLLFLILSLVVTISSKFLADKKELSYLRYGGILSIVGTAVLQFILIFTYYQMERAREGYLIPNTSFVIHVSQGLGYYVLFICLCLSLVILALEFLLKD